MDRAWGGQSNARPILVKTLRQSATAANGIDCQRLKTINEMTVTKNI